MVYFKGCLVFFILVVQVCYAQYGLDHDKKKHHHHHYGMHHMHFLYYLTFLAIKLKIIFFLGTIFTISFFAAKVVAIIKLTEYMKKKEHHHEEKVVYVNPHDHGPEYYGGHHPSGAASTFYDMKSYPPSDSDFSVDHPPEGAEYAHNERFSSDPGSAPPPYYKNHARNFGDEGVLPSLYGHFSTLAKRLRQLNITEMALNEMGIKDERCKRKFVCQADLKARKNILLKTGLDILRDVSYHRFKPNVTTSTQEDCDKLYPECPEN